MMDLNTSYYMYTYCVVFEGQVCGGTGMEAIVNGITKQNIPAALTSACVLTLEFAVLLHVD